MSTGPELEEQALLKEETFASKKEEAADKTKKLKKMFQKYQNAKQDLEDHGGRVVDRCTVDKQSAS